MINDTLVIIPTYNECDNVTSIIGHVLAQLQRADILIVDDNSPDGTGRIVTQLSETDSRVNLLHRQEKRGLGRAYIAGFQWGLARHYEYFVEMDADFSHQPCYLPTLVSRAREGSDLVLGSRYVADGGTKNWGWHRRLISRGGNVYAKTVLGVAVQDLTGGFKCFRRDVLEALSLGDVKSNGYSFQIEMTYRAIERGFRVEEVPIIFADRESGQSKMSKAIFAEAAWIVWWLRIRRLLKS